MGTESLSKLRRHVREKDMLLGLTREQLQKLKEDTNSYIQRLREQLALNPDEQPLTWLMSRASRMQCQSCNEIFVCDVLIDPVCCPFCQGTDLEDRNDYTKLVRKERAERKQREQ